jgi:gliding motility-associated-like protein
VICKNANLFVPNTFSPNGDGSNDVFYPRGTGLDRVKMLRIFNRWGEVVFEKKDFPINDPLSGWDGAFKGRKPQADVYIYQVEVFCENGEIITLNGNIALIL